MDNQDKIFEKIKNASLNQEAEFPSMEKVWSRVEEKLDKKVLTKQHNQWKKLAIAASVLLFVTLTYQFLKPEPQIVLPKNEVVSGKTKAAETISESPAKDKETQNPIIKEEAPAILKEQLAKPQVAVAEEIVAREADSDFQEPETEDMMLKSKKANVSSPRKDRFQKGHAFEAISVKGTYDVVPPAAKSEDKKEQAQVIGNSQAPLVVLDGKAITGKEALEINTVSEGIAKIDPDDSKEIVVLKEPLYIINGHYYSEDELFGPNPTSPYAPLNQQEIETISILQGEKAIANYGKRGEKGVVVITTKNRKPAAKSAKTSAEKAK
ncbi:hypothetical protein [Flavobacterium sp.]|uniref:hypothetical protein n=1 Tax=Flavobacterium sp. TaxID=239 RepID=UPI0039E52FA0